MSEQGFECLVRDLPPDVWEMVRMLEGVVRDARAELSEKAPMGVRIERADQTLRRGDVNLLIHAVEKRKLAELGRGWTTTWKPNKEEISYD